MTVPRAFVLLSALVVGVVGACSPLPPLTPAERPSATAGGAPGDAPEPEPPEPPEPDVDAIVTRAEQALSSGDQPLAEKLAREAILLDAVGYPAAYVVLGEVAAARGQHEAALASFEKAMALDAADPWATVHASESLAALGRRKEGRDLLRGFVTKHADAVADVYDALGSAELDLDDPTRAEAAFRVALERSGGKDADALYGLVLVAQERRLVGPLLRALRALLDLEPGRREALARDPDLDVARKFAAVRALLTAHGGAAAGAPASKHAPRTKRR